MGIDQRQGVRKILRTKAMLVIDGAAPALARTFDLGQGGMAVTTEKKVEVGQGGQVVFELLVEGKPQLLTCRVKVAHCIFSGDEFKVGFAFGTLAPEVNAAIAKYIRT
ncbi:PilZ domain-containing protein [Pseudoduganella buxea]|uniref:PilZ domain-containing protein n=1 Tax=Pseudoduganella buxea TaxID=1949069 RepID=A0A6I3T3M0_9BURK|nr:PilZ domain-containing protein [Pseudoduganella buxea]MTV56178.1 PilZ domain-containing protein [Pseudoduganella buxea]